ncbi:MAG: DUF1848 domain-containing protein [Candidatus Scalindua sp. AMX11]|nr:MAG: DUF1848 domain-containing protein [Candidatus Scalindua sp.]NOG84748.1 DUF1848 domain-containing protein [Planctomycetota bacterium]RZV98353.1 MAG: DUF1848 domain-containing protein [Candidatus Scalindua sp. SCAELEC01]TDE66554.1 MAG: DUF1848 domain-containing protein [Candidatus Scalindua sp. AMX11]GJQ58923.1 MAG: hypothetical protein SCALA701_17240 [Candidatus Scalindua sp.]
MIISASRRTDIPAFYAEWFMNRIYAGFCEVQNPFNSLQVSRIPLRAADVDVIVFWTRNPRPLIPKLSELDSLGYRYYFLYTLMDNPRYLDPNMADLDSRIETFQKLSEMVGPDKVIWRYDPIVLGNGMKQEFHLQRYEEIASRLCGVTKRSIISFVDFYRKIQRRLDKIGQEGHCIERPKPGTIRDIIKVLLKIAHAYGIEVYACAEEEDYQPYGLVPSKCIDDQLIKNLFNISVTGKKDSTQRKSCHCVESRDIGSYNTCLYRCVYCYATSNFDRARNNHKLHNPEGTQLLGR